MSSVGRPSSYTPEIAERICAALAEGKSLRTVCDADDMPSQSMVYRWLKDGPAEFREQYAQARANQAQILADDLLEIADDGRNDTYKTDDGEKVNYDHIQRSKLRVDTRKWLLSKMLPKVYGDKLQHTGADGESPVGFVMYGSKEAADTEEWAQSNPPPP